MKIRNFQDLINERLRLESALAIQKMEVRMELREVKEIFIPLTSAMKWLPRIQQSIYPTTLASAGANAGIDILIKNKILTNSHWVVRTIVPFVLKRFSNLFLGAKKKK